MLAWRADCIIFSGTGANKFSIINTKLYNQVVTLSTQDNAKLLQQLKPDFKRTISSNKYRSKAEKRTKLIFRSFG